MEIETDVSGGRRSRLDRSKPKDKNSVENETPVVSFLSSFKPQVFSKFESRRETKFESRRESLMA